MATGATKMSYNAYQNGNGKFNAMAGNSQKDMEVTQDMHLKMSKKIAQLTKVIYALNTKNDEHDAIVQNLKEQHEEQTAQLLAETKTKLETYRQRISSELEHKRSLEAVQVALKEQLKHKEVATVQFEEFKRKAEEREAILKTQHSEQLLSMSQEVLQIKKDFESRLQMIDTLKQTYEDEKVRAIEDLKSQYVEEVERIRKEQDYKNSDLTKTKEVLEKKYQNEIEELSKKCTDLKLDRDKLTEEYELKLSKAQAFYEKELEVLRQTNQAGLEEKYALLQEEQEKLRKDYKFKESEFEKRVNGLVSELSLREEEVEKTRQELETLRASMSNKDANSQLLNEQLSSAKQEANDAITRLKQVEAELAGSRQRCEQQAAELLTKATELGELEATRMQQTATITDLQTQLSNLKDKVTRLEATKRTLEERSHNLESEQGSQLRSLERALEDLSIEKRTLMEKFEREVASLKDTAHKKEQKLIADHQAALSEKQRQSEQELEQERQEAAKHLAEIRRDLESRLATAQEELDKSRQSLSSEMENTKADLLDKLKQAEDEVSRLSGLVQQSEQGLGSASSQIQSLTEAADKLRSELNTAHTELRTTKSKSSSLQSELDKLQQLHEQKTRDAAEELKQKMNQLSIDLDIKWTETLRSELSKQQQDLTNQKEEDKRAALAQLVALKDKEIVAERQGWQNKLQELLSQISSLKSKLTSTEDEKSNELERIQSLADAENRKLRQELLEAAEQYSDKIDSLEKMYASQLQALRDSKEQETKTVEERLRQRHLEDMKAQMLAHKATMDTLKETSERAKEQELNQLHEDHEKRIEAMQIEIQHCHAEDMEESSRTHQMELAAARMELDRAIELAHQRDGEYAMEISDMKDDIRHREQTLKSLEAEIGKLQQGLNEMGRELDEKGKEILRIRSEANHTLRAREEALQSSHAAQLSQLHDESQQDRQDMLTEFAQAQDLLKDKITAMQLMLEEAEERYQARDSRPEDLDMIRKLQEAIQEREAVVKKLLDEKRYYQMELVNRETNFNKVFSASPNVGVLNPFQTKKKPGDKTVKHMNSSPALSLGTNRLDPLPGSPIHDEKFNNNRPLPPAPMSKKFVK